ncbi:hypothetical protein AAHE18_13G157000 [Arachis hypogaea]|nr:uncharacterized protein LOC112735834 isoform X1 [Arachis hypogaea]
MLPPPTHLQIWSQHLLHGRCYHCIRLLSSLLCHCFSFYIFINSKIQQNFVVVTVVNGCCYSSISFWFCAGPLMDVPCIQDRVFYFLARTYKIRIEAIEEPGIFQIRSSVKDLMLCYISILSTWLRWKATRFMLESLCNDLQMI